MSLSHIRREYAHATLSESEVDRDPVRQFEHWLAAALAAELSEPNAMTLATATPEGVPSARIVLLKGIDERGFVFFTDYRSRKGMELERNPQAALVFYWGGLERQVRVTGTVSRVSQQESAAYFESRPLASRLSAWASHQSAPLAGRAVLEERAAAIARQYGTHAPPPLPPYWGGFRLAPQSFEFWQGRENRLHDRVLYTRESPTTWRIERLSP